MLKEDFIFVLETWMEPQNDKTYHLDGYEAVFAKRGRGKGIGIFYRKDANIEVCNKELYQFIKLKNGINTIFCVYASKGCNFEHLVDDLKLFDFNDNENTFLVGDLNFDASKKNNLTYYLQRVNFIQLVNHASHLLF